MHDARHIDINKNCTRRFKRYSEEHVQSWAPSPRVAPPLYERQDFDDVADLTPS